MPTDVIKNWLHYVESGQASPDLIQAESLLGTQRLRVVLIKILGWMKAAQIKLSPLPLNPNHEWVQNLKVFVGGESDSLPVQIVDGTLDFADCIQPTQREDILAIVRQNHKPPLHVRPATPDSPPQAPRG